MSATIPAPTGRWARPSATSTPRWQGPAIPAEAEALLRTVHAWSKQREQPLALVATTGSDTIGVRAIVFEARDGSRRLDVELEALVLPGVEADAVREALAFARGASRAPHATDAPRVATTVMLAQALLQGASVRAPSDPDDTWLTALVGPWTWVVADEHGGGWLQAGTPDAWLAQHAQLTPPSRDLVVDVQRALDAGLGPEALSRSLDPRAALADLARIEAVVAHLDRRTDGWRVVDPAAARDEAQGRPELAALAWARLAPLPAAPWRVGATHALCEERGIEVILPVDGCVEELFALDPWVGGLPADLRAAIARRRSVKADRAALLDGLAPRYWPSVHWADVLLDRPGESWRALQELPAARQQVVADNTVQAATTRGRLADLPLGVLRRNRPKPTSSTLVELALELPATDAPDALPPKGIAAGTWSRHADALLSRSARGASARRAKALLAMLDACLDPLPDRIWTCLDAEGRRALADDGRAAMMDLPEARVAALHAWARGSTTHVPAPDPELARAWLAGDPHLAPGAQRTRSDAAWWAYVHARHRQPADHDLAHDFAALLDATRSMALHACTTPAAQAGALADAWISGTPSVAPPADPTTREAMVRAVTARGAHPPLVGHAAWDALTDHLEQGLELVRDLDAWARDPARRAALADLLALTHPDPHAARLLAVLALTRPTWARELREAARATTLGLLVDRLPWPLAVPLASPDQPATPTPTRPAILALAQDPEGVLEPARVIAWPEDGGWAVGCVPPGVDLGGVVQELTGARATGGAGGLTTITASVRHAASGDMHVAGQARSLRGDVILLLDEGVALPGWLSALDADAAVPDAMVAGAVLGALGAMAPAPTSVSALARMWAWVAGHGRTGALRAWIPGSTTIRGVGLLVAAALLGLLLGAWLVGDDGAEPPDAPATEAQGPLLPRDGDAAATP